MFATHMLNEAGFAAMSRYKTEMSFSVSLVVEMMPEGRDKALFLTNIETAVFYGAKAIAAKPENHTEIINYPEFNDIDEGMEYNRQAFLTKYKEPEFPDYGVVGSCGSAKFDSEEIARKFLGMIQSYYDGNLTFDLEWTGSGMYWAKPSMKKNDCSGELCRHIDFVKQD